MNALKHAFPTGEGQITVTYESKEKKWKLSIGDDGVGLSATHMASHEGLGTSIVESLSSQLNAEVQRESTMRGTVVSITHPCVVSTVSGRLPREPSPPFYNISQKRRG